MTFKHLSENPRQQARAWNIALGVPGFRYADLNRVRRLEALDRAFLESLRGEDTGLGSAFGEVGAARMPDAALSADPERELAEVTMALLEAPASGRGGTEEPMAAVLAWTRALAFHPALAPRRRGFASFHVPHKTDYAELVPRVRPRPDLPEYFAGPPETRRYRDGFDLTDPRNRPRENLRDAHYS